MTTGLGQLEPVVEPEWVKALYRAGIGITNCGRSSEGGFEFVRVELLESAT
jgi:hypothetical protein